MDLPRLRLHAQQLATPSFEKPSEVVRWFGAVQAQDYLGALWAVGLRLPNATERSIEDALKDRSILRTWPMRGTLHFVAAEDARWMLELTSPRIVARSATRLAQLGLDEPTFKKSRKVIARVLRDGKQLSRGTMYAALEAAKISTAGQRGIHILWRVAQDGLICFGAREGKQQTFTLLEEWAPDARRMARDEALAEVATRYFTAHGPATLQDFTWWTGLAVAEARTALAMVESRLVFERVDDTTYWRCAGSRPSPKPAPGAHLLPAFDEYLVGYTDRTAVLENKLAVNAGGGMLAPTMVIGGQVVGTWKRVLAKKGVRIALSPFTALDASQLRAMSAPAARYGAFLGSEASVSVRKI
ncbi:MAG: winged helix DNA-binding domain-containing protein [Polyangiaceae bacterium]